MTLYKNEPEQPHPKLEASALVIGCVDARLNPSKDIGIPDGSAYIMRTIAAIVPPYDPNNADSRKFSETLDRTLAKGIRHIINMPHTHCGGAAACHCGAHEGTTYIKEHLKPIEHLDRTQGQSTFEEDVARVNIHNLLTYPQIKQRTQLPLDDKDRIELHGWLLDTITHQIKKVNTDIDKDTGEDHIDDPLTPMKPLPEDAIPADIISQVRAKQKKLHTAGPAPVHNPQVLIMSDLDASINPSTDFAVPYGQALIYRNELGIDESLSTSQLAALEFATTFKGKGPDNKDGIKKIVLMGHFDSREQEPPIEECKQRLQRANSKIQAMRDSHIIKHARPIAVESWVIDVATKQTYQFKENSYSFTPATPDLFPKTSKLSHNLHMHI